MKKHQIPDERIVEMIQRSGRVPRVWAGHAAGGGSRAAVASARRRIQRELQLLRSRVEAGVVVTENRARARLIETLVELAEQARSQPIDSLIGPDPRIRRTVVFLDCGDTIADEGTEVKDEHEVTQRARLIPGAARTLRALKARGYTLALVADGPRATFENILKPHRLWHLFDSYAISQEVGELKPSPSMFLKALGDLGIGPADYRDVVMVGNNLYRDIKGANDLGLTTVWLDWAPRRSKVPANASEVPTYTIKRPIELLELIESMEHTPERELHASE